MQHDVGSNSDVYISCYSLNIKESGLSGAHYTISDIRKSIETVKVTSSYRHLHIEMKNSLCVCFSTLDITWVNGLEHGELLAGQFTVFDSECPISYKVTRVGSLCFVFIPKYFYEGVLQKQMVRCGMFEFVYVDAIRFILTRVNSKEDGEQLLISELLALGYLLSVLERKEEAVGKKVAFEDKVHEVIKDNMLNPSLYLDDIALILGCSKRKIQHCLSLQGVSFTKLVTKYRIEYLAEQLIRKKHSRIDVLCYESGFNSPGYASNSFKVIMGMSPKEYRCRYLAKSSVF
uniref:HTH araC/xylS-type domain-containing protein n=1 Tax=Aliivibrio fischeri TaxID=668 RepID=H2ES88_ALIFS|nr:AraC family transcriptional regulator [Aliivibrio fischeri]AEY78255.1 hypothetical protein [Aliivibrio fischeri]